MSSQSTSSTPVVNGPLVPRLNIQRVTSNATNVFPWNHLPTELKTMILSYSCPGIPSHIAPVHFGLVCHGWRALTWTIHTWWTQIELELDPPTNGGPYTLDEVDKIEAAYRWLSRAGNRPTTIKITHLNPNRTQSITGYYLGLYEKLFKEKVPSSLGNLVLEVHPHVLGCIVELLGSNEGGCSKLMQLNVVNSWDHGLPREHQALEVPFSVTGGTYPSLQEVSIFDTSPHGYFLRYLATSAESCGANLTHLSLGHQQPHLEYFETIYPILQQCVQLRTLGLTIPGWATDFELTRTLPDPIILQHLTRLVVHIIEPLAADAEVHVLSNIRPLLLSLTLPSLQSLSLKNDTSRWGPCIAQALADLTYHSKFPLTRLSVEGFELNNLLIIPLLRSLPTLERLDLADCRLDCITLLQAVKYDPSQSTTDNSTPFLPRLCTFQLIDTFDDGLHDLGEARQLLLDVVMSRWVIPYRDPMVQWQEVTILIPPLSNLTTWDRRSKEMLEWLADEEDIEVELIEFEEDAENQRMEVDA
ncbi:hypothetical protein BDN72DRAFT_902737 [Pluteus cervinus]|uniref:Uncharacterized protein n=1 Tax=Pluteus cervinus TaxID=181527 RepID=A0ACD3AAX2_9AGAR|nr:hypothetical protein BDN72DRAFT_902737 [Pluteus cervinus]